MKNLGEGTTDKYLKILEEDEENETKADVDKLYTKKSAERRKTG